MIVRKSPQAPSSVNKDNCYHLVSFKGIFSSQGSLDFTLEFFAKALRKDAIAVILETRSGPALALKGVTPPPSVPEGPMSDVGNSAPWPRHQSQCLLVNYSSCVQASEKLKAKKYISKYSSTHLISQFATKNVPASF